MSIVDLVLGILITYHQHDVKLFSRSIEIYGWTFFKSHQLFCGCKRRNIATNYDIVIDVIPVRWFIFIISIHIFFNRNECFRKKTLFQFLFNIYWILLFHIFFVIVDYGYTFETQFKSFIEENIDNNLIQSIEIQDGVLQLRQLQNWGFEIIHISTSKQQESIIFSNDLEAPTNDEVINYRLPIKLFNVAKNVTMSAFIIGKNNNDLTFEMIIENLFYQMDQLEYLEDHIRLEREPVNLIL